MNAAMLRARHTAATTCCFASRHTVLANVGREGAALPLDDQDERGQWRDLDLWRLIERRWEARKVGDSLSEYVFHRDGRRIFRPLTLLAPRPCGRRA